MPTSRIRVIKPVRVPPVQSLPGRWAVGLAACGGLLLFFIPAPQVAGTSVFGVSGSVFYHVFYFAFLQWAWMTCLPSRETWTALLCVCAIAAGVEVLQPLFQRTCELSDWMYGAGGAGIVFLSRFRTVIHFRWTIIIGGLLLVLLGPVWFHFLRVEYPERRAWPVLADFRASWSSPGTWNMNGVQIREARIYPLDDPPALYPGIFRAPAQTDWQRADEILLDVVWKADEDAVLCFRMDDQDGFPAYGDRFQVEMNICPGRNVLHIGRKEFEKTADGRPMHLDRITRWGLFLVSPEAFEYLQINTIRLELAKE